MAQPATNAKIEELRFRIKTDPKSRLFYPLAEELRKAGQVAEAEQVLRTGLTTHATYLSAWVSLGRVLRDLKKDGEAVDALNRALQLDPGNVVAARLLADAYLSLGEKVEAIKKYKLVYALLPADEDLKAQIEALDRELHPPMQQPAPPPEPEPEAAETAAEQPAPDAGAPFGDDTAVDSPLPTMESPFGETRVEEATGDAEPMSVAHDESPFEEPVDAYSAAALTIEAPAGFHIGAAPLGAELAAPIERSEDEELPPIDAPPITNEPVDDADLFEPAEPVLHPPDDLASTITMADLYAKQGLTDDARQIYEGILTRDPENDGVRGKLAALDRTRTIRRLENWLAKVSRREAGGV